MLEALREAVAQELPFPDTGSLEGDIRFQLHNFVKLLTGPRGRVFQGIIAAGQSDPKVAEAFHAIWVRPRRDFAIKAMQRYAGDLHPDLDLEIVMDAIYGPLYYRLLISRAPLTTGFADEVTDLVWAGMVNRKKTSERV